ELDVRLAGADGQSRGVLAVGIDGTLEYDEGFRERDVQVAVVGMLGDGLAQDGLGLAGLVLLEVRRGGGAGGLGRGRRVGLAHRRGVGGAGRCEEARSPRVPDAPDDAGGEEEDQENERAARARGGIKRVGAGWGVERRALHAFKLSAGIDW